MKQLFFIFLFFVSVILVGQTSKGIDYKHMLCEKKFEKEGVVWKHCDYYSERFTSFDTIRIYRQTKRENIEGVEKCGWNSKCWRFFNKNQFKESISYSKTDEESELSTYSIRFDRNVNLYKLTIKYKDHRSNKKYTLYDYYIYKIVQDNNKTVTQLVLVKTTCWK